MSNREQTGDDDHGLAIQEARPKLKKPPLYKVILVNDDYTPMEFVVQVLENFFSMDREKATQVMLHVHTRGVGVCWRAMGTRFLPLLASGQPIGLYVVLGIVLVAVPLNWLVTALDNGLFLLFPYRLAVKDAGQMPFMGRLMMVTFVKMMLLGLCAVLAAIPAAIR